MTKFATVLFLFFIVLGDRAQAQTGLFYTEGRVFGVGDALTGKPVPAGAGIRVMSPSGDGAITVGDLLAATRTMPSPAGPTSDALVAISSQMAATRKSINRLNESATLSAAMTIVPPNAGDRYALTFSSAADDGYAAGSISASFRISESVLGFVAYSRSSTQNLVKGGATCSFK